MSKLAFLKASVFDVAQTRRAVVLAGIYAAIAGASFYLAYEVRFDFIVPTSQQAERLRLLPLVVGVKLVALIYARQLGSLMTYFSVPDLLKLMWAMSASSAVLLLPRLFGVLPLAAPRGVLLADFMLCFGGLCAGRLATRLYRERLSGTKRAGNGVHPQLQRIAIIGAGDAGASLAKEFLNTPSRGFQPVMFFDDDPSKHGKLVHGVPVIGRPEAVGKIKDAGTPAKAVIAMPSAAGKRIREIVALFTQRGLKVETLPSLEELASGRVRASRIRPVEVQDLLGREPVNLDSAGIRKLIEGRVLLVTGAGGSIGSELCRQIAALNPERLLMVEQSEGALFIIEQEMNELGFGTIAIPLVADVLDRERIEYIFSRYRPDVVFHAAAHKHVFMMERQPAEAIRNNVLGTRQIARIAAAHGVDAVVLISTDKAINPTSVMGASKRLAELQLMAIAAGQNGRDEQGIDNGPGDHGTKDRGTTGPLDHGTTGLRDDSEKVKGLEVRSPLSVVSGPSSVVPGPSSEVRSPLSVVGGPSSFVRGPSSASQVRTKFIAVRFGNVLGSSGSVIPIFKRQIANGGPVTVTHPDVTRYFMTIPESVGLVLQSFALGKGGEIFVLDMGQPVKIVDLARQMIELSGFTPGDDIEITFTGLKPGEKLFEELQHQSEQYAPTEHPRIMRFTSNAVFSESGLQELEQQLYQLDSNELKAILQRLVPEYTPFID